ncbi:hypothetical protein F4779DRAFT_622692 [Xylariaceae sp. FL0662B]|nr:hypothetical protein F4779DRAFT_622692 [Xylariaceae sp. FL0662B]
MSRSSLPSLLILSLQLVTMFVNTMAQDAPLFIQGGLEDATATDETYNTGGTISINGFNIQVPKNMLVQFPAVYVPWKDFVEDKDSMIGYETNVSIQCAAIDNLPSAMNSLQCDPIAPVWILPSVHDNPGLLEQAVIGNFINGQPIAAQILTYEFFEGMSSGFIESINFEDGSMKISNGPTLRISDPNAVFTIGYTEAPFFTADDESPSISSFSGFPMCIPRNSSDPLCPATNRPFQGSGTFSVADPLSMAPFLPGDFVTFMGIRRGGEVICFSIVAQNVEITTLQDLVYIRLELGLLGISNLNPNTELRESRFVGYTSNPAATVAIYAMDYDPCTGAVTDRIVAAIGLRGGRNEQNKFEYRSDIFSGYAREYRVVAEIDGIPKTRTSKNGFLAGTYVQPVNVWVQGEQSIPGTPPPANDFSQMPWITQGVGVDEAGNLWGPLDPFPQTGLVIDAPACGPVSAATFEGDEVNTNWVPSATLLNGTLPMNSTSINTNDSTTAAATTTENAGFRERGVSNGRWSPRAPLELTTLPEVNPNLALVNA